MLYIWFLEAVIHPELFTVKREQLTTINYLCGSFLFSFSMLHRK